MKKKWLVVLAVALTAVLAACSSSSNSGSTGGTTSQGTTSSSSSSSSSSTSSSSATTPETEIKKVELRRFTAQNASIPHNDDWYVWKIIEEKTGVHYTTEVATGNLIDALNLVVSSGNMPDTLHMASFEAGNNFGMQGALVNMLDYVDIMPNFVKWMEMYPQIIQNSLSADGRLFTTPSQGISFTNRQNYIYREDIFEKHGLNAPATWDELYDVLRQLKSLYPDSYPFTFPDGITKILNFAPQFETGNNYYYNYETKEWKYGPIEDNYKVLIEYLRNFVAEGLIPPDFLTIDTKQWQDILSTDRAFVTNHYIGQIDAFNLPMQQENPNFRLAFMPPPAGWEGGPQLNAFTHYSGGGTSVTSTSEHIEDVMRLFDFYYSEEGRTMMSWGIEGETYTVGTDGKKRYIEDYQDVFELRNKTGLSTTGTYLWFDFEAHSHLFSPVLQEAYELALNYDSYEQPRPAFTADEIEVLSIDGQAITKYRDENVAKFILGTRSMDTWDQYVSDLEQMGVAKIVAIYKAAYDRVTQQ